MLSAQYGIHDDGTSQDTALQAGQALWIGAGAHAARSFGASVVRGVVFELKEAPAAR